MQLEQYESKRAVHHEKLTLLVEQSYIAAYISVAVGLLLLGALWDSQEHGRLLMWFAGIVLFGVLRILVLRSLRRAPPEIGKDGVRENMYVAVTLVYFLVWSVGGLCIMPANAMAEQVIVLYFLIGLAGSAVAVFSAHRALQLSSVTILLLPIVVWFFAQGDVQSVLMAVAGFVFLLSAFRSSRVLTDTIDQNLTLKHELISANEEVRQQARVDELTDLFNRRAFYEYGQLQAAQAARNKDELSLVLLDIDHFKSFNDSYGHATGDTALVHVAGQLKSALRSSDICGRVGGEEFALLLPNTSEEQACRVAESLRARLQDNPFSFPDGDAPITASFGVASVIGELRTAVANADNALYLAKEKGRNRVECCVKKLQDQ